MMPVARDLDAVLQPRREVSDGRDRIGGVALTDEIGGDELRVGVERDERPDVTDAALAAKLGGHVALLRVDERPNLIDFEALAFEVTHGLVFVGAACGSEVEEELGDSVLRDAGHAAGRPTSHGRRERRESSRSRTTGVLGGCSPFAHSYRVTLPLEGVRLKLDRADEHLDRLDREMRDRFDNQTYRVREKSDTRRLDKVIEILEQPETDPRWGPLIGDFAHNLRSALDHLAWQLALLNKRAAKKAALAGDPWPPRRNEFPIFADISHPRAKRRFKKTLSAFLVRHQRRIRGEQPYQRRGKAQAQPLWLLYELRNMDTHRVLHTLAPQVIPPDSLEPLAEDAPHQRGTTVYAPGATREGWIESELTVQANLAVYVTFDEPGSVLHDRDVLPLLRLVRDDVRRVVARFAADFTP